MRHESNWLEHIHKLANDQGQTLQVNQRTRETRTRAGTSNSMRTRDEWLQAGYAAQLSFPFRSGR